jgi:assimilatory nitrate reductase electron transfer subunit
VSEITKVVVIGNGMAGSRLVQELRSRDPDRRLRITVFAAEAHASYNRVLLSELLAGRTSIDDIYLVPDGWHDVNDVTVHAGVAVTAIDRGAKQVTASDGTVVEYDVLVLATGSVPWTPPVDGLFDAGELVDGAIAFRTVDDCRRIIDRANDARRVVVVGGGLLGLEAARGLVGRGLEVDVVHPMGHLMERQLDVGAGRVLAAKLRELGVRIRLGVTAAVVQTEEVDGRPRVSAVRLTDGDVIDTNLVVLACGIRPDVGLATEAGLRVEQGVVVDEQLRSVSDDAVFAIGECAQHDGLVYGLVAPAWEQAAVVADVISGVRPDARYTGSSLVTRLKAAGVDLAAMGDPFGEPGDEDREVVQFSDPSRGTYKKLVIRDGRLVGAILLGDCATAGTVIQLFDRRGPVPSDPLSLMFAGLGGPVAAATPALMPAGTKVCHCNQVTKRDIQECWFAGARSVEAVAASTRATTGCGTCRDAVSGIVDWLGQTAEPVEAVP